MDDDIEGKKNSLMDPNEYFENNTESKKNSIMKSKKWLPGYWYSKASFLLFSFWSIVTQFKGQTEQICNDQSK